MKNFIIKIVLISMFFTPNIIRECFAQNLEDNYLVENWTDTVKAKSKNYSIFHYHQVSKDIFLNHLYTCKNDEIFVDTLNNYSRLIFTHIQGEKFNIPTVPLTHLILLENKKLILGLSSYSISPYHIVIYNFEGKLLYKSTMRIFEIKFNKKELEEFIITYPRVIKCFELHNNAFKIGDDYFLEMSTCILNTIGRDSFLQKVKVTNNRYFPHIFTPNKSRYSHGYYQYLEYYNFFNVSDPLYDIITIDSIPYLLIINDTNMNRIHIPLVPNIDILKEFFR